MSTPPKSESPTGAGDSPRTPRGGRLRDRVSFFEQVWSGGATEHRSTEDLFEEIDAKRRVARFRSIADPRPSSRTSDSSFEESFERLVEEGELNGAKVVKFEKITVRKSVREIGPGTTGLAHHHRVLTESSRTPSEEHALEDSAYQSHSHGAFSHGSKSSSVTSFTRFPSEESLSQRRTSSPQQHLGPDDRIPSEWYAEYRTRSFHNPGRIEYVRTKSEYDAHIAEIKDEQERVQKKTFVNWINSYLSKRVPPLRVEDLIEDLKDGTRLLALLEVLSGEKLPVERGRNLKRPHFLSNANTALQFLQSKKIKLVNINSSDLVDGRPPVVLGLIWTIILYFQLRSKDRRKIEENTKALEYLGHTWGSQSSLESLSTQGSAASERRRISSEKWKQGARKTLLQWVTNALPKDIGIHVRDFGESWRDGNAFLAIIDAIRANLVNIAAMREASNRARLETAFQVAEVELGIARLLDPEDVDVPQPDEKSIMTYVAQFLHKYPEPGSAAADSFAAVQQEYDRLFSWLSERVGHLEQLERTNSFPLNFGEYIALKTEGDQQRAVYDKLQRLVETPSMISITRDSWRHIQNLWKTFEILMFHWLWLLDSALPGELGEVGRWLGKAEALLISDNDIPEEMTEETANIISNKLEDHKKFFLDLPSMTERFQACRNSQLAMQVQPQQLNNMAARLESLPDRAAKRRIRLKFLEHKCCLIAFLFLVETKLKGWSVKYGTEERVHQMLEQYRNFVSRNRIFQEFQKAYLDMQQVVDDYKREGNVDKEESFAIDRFMRETGEKWKSVSMDLRCVQSMLEEVVAYWRRWNVVSDEFEAWLIRAEPALMLPEEERMEFFQDISVWKEKHQQLSDTVTFLIATSDEPVAMELKQRYSNLTARWESLFQEAKQYMHAGDLIRNRKDYRAGVETLQNWLRNVESALAATDLTTTEKIKAYGEKLEIFHNEVEGIEDLFKSISKKFQTLIQDLSRDEVDKMMSTLKKEKEALVKVRALIPMQLHLYHQLLVQQESLEAGQKEIAVWLDEAERMLTGVDLSGGREHILAQLDRHKAFFSRTLYYKSMLESKNKVFGSIVKSVDSHADVATAEGGKTLRELNERFNKVSRAAQTWEQRLQEAVRCWSKFKECERQVSEWLSVAETMINDKHTDNRRSIEYHKNFFGNVNEKWIQDFVNAGQDLKNILAGEQQTPIVEAVEALQKRWKEVLSFAPLHLMRLEFRLDETTFLQYLKEIELEINSEQQALMQNENVDSILERNKEFFVSRGTVLEVEKCLQTLKKISHAYGQLKPNDGTLLEATQNAERLWEDSAQRVERLRDQLKQVPQQWAAYKKKLDEMVVWMDHVDANLRTILHEVNTLEEFETERTIFQVQLVTKICREADSKREEMKWLVQTLDSLTSNRSDHEALSEQNRLEQLITRYKNLIPTIEITMTKTDIYSKSYTYRKEVREVCTLLRKVREQSKIDVLSETPENLQTAVTHQETRLGQLEQQRSNIVSMLQRGKDLLKDQHAPPFVSLEVQQLESSWNDTYGQSVETLKSLKSTQKLWNTYTSQKEEILKLIEQAEEELKKIESTSYYDASQVSSDLQNKQDFGSTLRKSSEELLKKLRETYGNLADVAPTERKEMLKKEMTQTEKKMETTLKIVQEKVVYLREHSNRWNKFQAKMNELQLWAQQTAPQSIADTDNLATTPEEMVYKTESLQNEIEEKRKTLKFLEQESRNLVKGDSDSGPGRQLRGDIVNLEKTLETLKKSIVVQRDTAGKNLETWKEYEKGIRELKPWIEEAESKAATIGSKPTTLAQAAQMLDTAKAFEMRCQQHFTNIQELSLISQRLAGKTSASDQVDAVHTRWNAVHDVAVQATTKLDKLVTSWNSFESEIKDFNEWLEKSEKAVLVEPNTQTPEVSVLEKELSRLKEFNKTISDHQAQLISLTQVSDHISHGLSLEGASNLKSRVSDIKSRVSKLADTVRLQLNKISDSLLARQEFQMKITDFENWMSRLRSNIAEISEATVDTVDTNLQAVHAYIQEHSEKQPSFAAIYNEVKQLSSKGSVVEAAALDETYATLAMKYKALEDDLRQKKKELEKWIELLSWLNDANGQLSHCKYEAEARKPTVVDLDRFSSELQSVYEKIDGWKQQILPDAGTGMGMGIQIRDKQGKPLSASGLLNDLENKAIALKNEISAKRDKLENLGARWNNFRKLQENITEKILNTQTALQETVYSVDCCKRLAPAVEKIDRLIEEHRKREQEKEVLHFEGSCLMKEDQRSTTNIQVVLSSVDANWEKVNELVREQRKKYADMDTDWKAYEEAREKVKQSIDEANALRRSVEGVPYDVTQANLSLEKHRKALEVLKKGKQYLEKMDTKAQHLTKEASLMPNFNSELIDSDLNEIRQNYQDVYSDIGEKLQTYESRVIIWKQIEESKSEVIKWLTNTNDALTTACERSLDVDNCQARLIRYREELPAHRQLYQNILAKIEQLIKFNNDADIPTLNSLRALLDDQFKLVKSSADKLEYLTSTMNEKERTIRQEMKRCGDAISKIREDIIKCDDLTGENTKILNRINKCQELKTELEQCDYALSKLEETLTETSTEYPSISRSSLPKELQALQLRRDGVASHANKVVATLVAFLTKLYHEKFGALQRMVVTLKEKVAWCEPEQSSDRYNLEVKMASLLDVEAGIADCIGRKEDTDNSLKLLASVESAETMTVLKAERDRVNVELDALKSSYGKIKNDLERNIALWQRYEVTSENVLSWLKENENKIRAEASMLLDTNEIEAKIDEMNQVRKTVTEYQTELKDLSMLAEDITKVSSESRVNQYIGHLNTRYEYVVKFLSQHLERLQGVKENRDRYAASKQKLEAWLENAEQTLKIFDEITGPKPITFYQSRLKELKAFGEERELGQAILNRTAEAGETLFARITPDQRETIRAELRNFRNRVDAMADRSNVIYKKIESDMMHRSSFEDKFSQVKQWLADAQSKLEEKQDLLPTLQEKKFALHLYKAVAQDVTVHKNILQQLQQRLTASPDDEASEMLASVIEAYEKLSSEVEGRINIADKHVSNHEAYLQTFEKTRDWINTAINEGTPIIEDFSVEREMAQNKIASIESLLQQKTEADRILFECNQQLNIVLEQTSLPGHQALVSNFEQQKKIWEEFLKRCAAARDKLNHMFDQWSEFEKIVQGLEGWIKQTEIQLKDQSLKSSEDAKRAHLQKLKSLEEGIVAKGAEFNAVIEKSQSIEAEADLATRVSRQTTKYQAIKNQVKEAVMRYEQFVKEHNAFNVKYTQLLEWIEEIRSELKRQSEIVGDLSVLQSRQKRIRDLGDTRTKENARFESVIDLGEKLYVHTSPDGREIIRQQLRNLRTLWDGFSEELQGTTQKLDQCLMQFAEFSLSHEQLTAWLRDVERTMHQHTELKCTLEEKRAQLQNHKIMHQEIMSHQSLVESVCDKAQQLVDQTKDTSLNVFLPSIKQLFHNIVAKSKDLLENLADCVEKHHRFNLQAKGFSDWLNSEREKLAECNDLTGERADISRRLATLTMLKDDQMQGAEYLGKLKELSDSVTKRTAPKGWDAIHKEITVMEGNLRQYLTEIESVEQKQKAALQKWQDFEDKLEAHTKWFSAMEAAFRDQQLQPTLREKETRLATLKEKRDSILKKESKIDEFVDKSHSLLHASGVERIKPMISQISNRYQLLHVLSKEVVTRCQSIADDHRAYEEKLKGFDEWIARLEQSLSNLKKDETGRNLEEKVSRLQILLAEKEQGEHRLAGLASFGERILADTSAQGRELIRHELRQARERWDKLVEEIAEQQKKQDAQSLQWSNYQETLQQILAWLDAMERSAKQDSSIAWSSLQEIKSKLLKSKAMHQEILAYKRIIEGVSEKANALTYTVQTPSDARQNAASVSERYEDLVDMSQKNMSNLETLLDTFQQFYDLQKSYQDYQKQQWEQLANYSDYTGNKAALQAQLTKIMELQDGQREGELKLNILNEHVAQSARNLTPRSLESMERDLATLRFEHKKFATAVNDIVRCVEERIQQWSEYENSLERLLAWLADAESSLKNYSLKNTLDEKQEQLEKYQALQKTALSWDTEVTELVALGDHLDQMLIVNLRQNEAEFDRMSDESSELMQISGETRFSASVQQITSRFQSIQATAKELVKKCEQAVSDHAAYLERYKQCSEWLANARTCYRSIKDDGMSTREELASNVGTLKDLSTRQSSATLLINNTVEAGERLYPTTGTEGREIVRQQLLELQQAFEELYDSIASTERELRSKISRWSGFEESNEAFEEWLRNIETQLKAEIELKTTLDEKRAQLQIYRTFLHDAQTHQQDLLDLRDKGDNLPDSTDKVHQTLKMLNERHAAVLKRAATFVERYEGIVSDHQQYSKSVLDTHEWLDATHNAVILWGDTELERVSLHTNLDRLKNLLQSLPEDEPRVQQIRTLGEKVIPGTLESGQINIRSQIDSSQQEWESLVTAVNSTIDTLENKLQQWNEFETSKERCLAWMRETDTKLHAVDLKPTLLEKKDQLEMLRTLQGQVRAKELEIDAVTEKAQQLHKNLTSRTSQVSELSIKYQQISNKVKDLNGRWHQYVTTHQELDNQVAECTRWLDDIRKKLAYCSDLGASSQKDLENKMEIVQDLLLCKEDGFGKVQGIVELAQTVLANTAPTGHKAINDTVGKLQEQWSALASKMLETKTNLDDSINKWAGLLEQIQSMNKTVEYMQTALNDFLPFQTTMAEKRCQLERVKALEEKIRCENIEVDGLKMKVAEMIASGPQGLAASQAQTILNRFDALFEKIKSLLIEREEQYKDHRLYKEAHDDIINWLSRAREKIPSMKQRPLSDKLAIENAVAPLESLLNKKAQGELLVEHLQHTGKVVCASTSPQGQEIIKNEVRALTQSFEELFKEIRQQKDQLEQTVGQWREYKDEYERLSDWLQQFDILVKAQKNSLLPNVAEKEKQVREVKEILEKLLKGQEQIDKFNKTASGLLSSHLDTYVNNQLRHLNSRYQVQVNLAKDVLNKVETNLAQHQEYEANLAKTRAWIENAKQIIRKGTEAASTSSREELQNRLDNIQELLRKREEGQNLVHLTVNCGEKVTRNTRSDGREEINAQLKEIQNDWERLVKKISTTKVHLETSLLQWADYSSSYLQLQQWINDREAKLQQVCEQKVSKARKGLAGLSSLAIGERKANLRQTNSIVQDIVAFEPMIQSVTTKAEDLRQATPATEISIKYETLSKQAQELYAKQKETVEQHQAFIDSGNEFVQWIRAAKERLGKCSEPTGDKESLANKITQLKVLQSELPEGQKKLEHALEQGNAACQIADEEDKEIIEEEVALLQEEYDSYVDSLNNTKSLLEVGIVKWTEYEDQFSEAAEWLTQTEQLVQSFNKLQDSLEEKKNVLEQFQIHLQTLFDWQKELDRLNMKAQMLLETCADTRISNAITQLTTKYNALLSLAKEIMRRLELHYQEHQQHNTLYQECQDWIERTRDKLGECKEIPSTLAEVNNKLHTCKTIRQTLEQGQNKLRYALELKEKVIMNTEQNGAAKIQEDTENLKTEFEKLLVNVEDIRQKLSVRATALEELNKIHRLTTDWIDEIEGKIQPGEMFKNDLSEKRAVLEKYKTVHRDIQGHGETVDRLKARLAEDSSIPVAPYQSTFAKYDQLNKLISDKIRNLEEQVNDHEKFQQAQNEAADWVRQTKLELQQHCDTHGEKERIIEREKKVDRIIASLPRGETLISKVIQLSDAVISSTGPEGQEAIGQDVKQLQSNWKSLQSQCHDSQKTLSNCISSWSRFTGALDSMKRWIDHFQKKVNDEQSKENKTPEDLVRCKSLVEEAIQQKPVLEELNDKCEALLEMSACSWARDKTVQLQSAYTSLLTDMQSLVSKVEKNLSDHTEFLKAKKEMEDWLRVARGSVQDCMGVGDAEWAKDKLETIKIVTMRITEGQHLLSTLQTAFAKAIETAVPEQQEQLRTDMAGLRSGWEQLSIDLNTVQARLKSLLSRWDDHGEAHGKFQHWLDETEKSIRKLPDTKGEFGDMKTMLERYKHIQEEVAEKKTELDHLIEEASELSKLAKKNRPLDQTNKLLKRWQDLSDRVDERKKLVENEMQEYNAYHAALQETEKWLLQISFQLMAHNSLYITSKEQTISQIKQHDNLLEEIEMYTSVLEDLKLKGNGQISRYVTVNTEIKTVIETQLQNVQESYNSLLNTALQIKKRLAESLIKFQEYENTLESIMKNLDAYEPEITQEMEAPFDTLEQAKERFENARTLHNKLQAEKTRLALAVEACEAAVACVSRPGSPLDAPPVQIPAREVEVRTKLEDLIDQAQGHLMNATKAVSELEEQTRQKNALRTWINQQRALCAEWKSRPAKLRSEAAHAELQAMNDLLGNVGERRTHAITELSIHEEDRDIEEGLEKLERELTDAIAAKQAAQELIQKYRSQVQNIQSWLDALSKKIDVVEKGNGQTIGQKIASAKEIASEFESQGPDRLNQVKSLGDRVMDSVSNLDSQQIEEQIKSVERRYADTAKKLQRKAQVLDMTAQGIEATRQEIEENRDWIQLKKQQAQLSEPVGYDSKLAEERLLALKAMLKEAEGKQMVIDTLEKRVGNMQNELEGNEQQQLENETKALRGEQAELCTILTEGISSATAAADARRKFEGELDRARAWIKSKSNNLKKLSGYLPLKAAKVEQDIEQHSELEADIDSFSEKDLNDILKQGNTLLKECSDEDRARLETILDELNKDYQELKGEAREKQAALADLLQGRKAFESEIDKCQRWINEAEVATSSDLRTSSIDILREQLAKYDRLKMEANEYESDIEKIIQQGKSILPTVSDADKLELSEQLQNMREAHGRVAGIINERALALQKSIDEAEESLARVAEAVQYMTDVQKELQELNKPIGARVEDVEAMLDSYERILNDLKANKAKLSDLGSVNVADLHGVLAQQDDLVKAIESQISKLRQLLLLRQQFLALIAEITTFVAKYTEIVRDIETSGLTTEEKIKRYDDAILKIQECEATLASATDKGQQIAAEGSTVDRNNITEQLQSLKLQLQALRRAVETQREQHELAAAEHKRLANELAEILEWLEDKEKEVKSRPLLERDPASVEAELNKHQELCETVNEHLDRITNLKNSIPYEEGMPGSLKEMLSEAVSLLSSLPREMEERGNYLENNIKLRLEYAALTDKLHGWVREAEIRLESDKNGLDFENILSDLEEHKIYFSSEPSIRELVSQQIQQAADKIWPSLTTSEQEELSVEQQQHTQLLKNTLNTAKSQRARLEQGAETWRDYTQTLERVRAVIGRSRFTDEPVTTLAGLQFNIQKITHALNDIQNQQFELDLLNERGREVLRLADANNKKTIEAQSSEIGAEWKELVSGLEGRRDALEALSKHWEDLEAQWSLVETRVNATEEKSKLVDTVVRSKQHLHDTIKALRELVAEGEKLKPMTDELKALVGPVLAYLAAFTEDPARVLEKKLNKLQNSVDTLVVSLRAKSKKADEDLETFESAEREIEHLRKRLNEARDRASSLYVFGSDQDATEEELDELRSAVDELLEAAKNFSGSTKARYQASQQLIPSDLGQHLTALELCAEATAQVMEEKQREQKRARTVRSDYLTDLDEVQAWMRQAELKVQDRSVEPSRLKEQLKQVQDELSTIADKLERLTRNGRSIAENTRDEAEKQLINSTVHNCTEQLNQLRNWLDERKQAVADTIDAWQRFLTLYETVKNWTEEKKEFLVEPLKLATLAQARQRLHEYSTAVKSCKQINKHLSDMGKELENIGQVCSVGDLPEKLLEAEEAKVRVEGQLLERNALLQETSEEWEQCERKLKEVKTWIEKARQNLDSPQSKKKPLRDQHIVREKMLSDIAIQKTKISISMEKLQVHFRSGIGGDSRIGDTVDELLDELDGLHSTVKEQTTSLEACLAQIDRYQQEIQHLRQQIVQVEQQLRTVLSPTYLSSDKEKALQEQQIYREKIKSLQSKIQSRTERSKILAQRGTPDLEPLDP
ncbi:muscle-specific protein 300 kDa isoform X2 [Hylaeus anthracinus]|uniref:muscle-specific protein 300 kDa isoform X2 n=1 Tax=Hylaeus anthracinus TaxID=313031 RepID=UPI0023B92591|nr:muscle-specific protein 300 kDa isoform X2 [Hylaeus anthracinus]